MLNVWKEMLKMRNVWKELLKITFVLIKLHRILKFVKTEKEKPQNEKYKNVIVENKKM